MRFPPFLFTLVLTLAVMVCPGLHAADEDEKASARNAVLELAGAFTANDGYKLRDGFYSSTFTKGQSKVVAVNLYIGNHYWFCSATIDPAKKMEVQVFDETGAPMPILTYQSGGKAAAGFTPSSSGIYYVKTTLAEGDPARVCFIYTYK